MKNKKKIIILRNNGGRLGNHLWYFISVYAYCLERGYECENYSFFEYSKYFNISTKNLLLKYLFFNNISFLGKQGLIKTLFLKYTNLIKKIYPKQVIQEDRENVFYLPPSSTDNLVYRKKLALIEKSPYRKIYLDGWLFRNPVGIKKYRKEIVEYFRPRAKIRKRISNLLARARKKYEHVVGVHIRQGDYRHYRKGELFFTQQEVKEILKDYLRYKGKKANQVLFVICSDEKIQPSIFKGLRVKTGLGGMVEDLYALAATDIVIGSNSTFSGFAAYYGNVPFVVFEKKGVDWSYYKDRKGYFENKKCDMIHY